MHGPIFNRKGDQVGYVEGDWAIDRSGQKRWLEPSSLTPRPWRLWGISRTPAKSILPKTNRLPATTTQQTACSSWVRKISKPCARAMDKDYLILKRASASRPSGEWDDDDYDVLADGVVVGRIMETAAAPVGQPWMWTLAFGHHEDRTPTHGYAATREAAMTAFAKSWRRE
jgi:hypothetical protein